MLNFINFFVFLYKNLMSFWVKIILIILNYTATAAKSLQSCPTLCDPVDGSPPGSPAPGILQARTLEWVAITFSNAEKWKVKRKSLSHVWLLATPWTTAYQAPPSMGFSRQEYWSGVQLPSPILNYMSAYFSITLVSLNTIAISVSQLCLNIFGWKLSENTAQFLKQR